MSDWLVNETGQCQPLPPMNCEIVPTKPYRLYRFLTDLEDLLETVDEHPTLLGSVCWLTRQLLSSSPWLQMSALEPDPETGWSVLSLYDEPDFPLTVQLVSWSPGSTSPVHNHATWGAVAILSGYEKNIFWQHAPDAIAPNRVEPVAEKIFAPGEIITFLPPSIHSIVALGDEPTISFNIYGETAYEQRFEFNPETSAATQF